MTLTSYSGGSYETIPSYHLFVIHLDAAIEQLRQHRLPWENQASGGAWLGIMGADLTPEITEAMSMDPNQEGVLIQQVLEGSPADTAGLRGSYKSITIQGQSVLIGGDVIVALDEKPVSGVGALQSLLGEHQPGDQAPITVLRDNEQVIVMVELGLHP